jgi:hypothetical protein
MSRKFCLIRSSRFLRSAYQVWALLAISYVLFEVLDIDGSNLPRLLVPAHRSVLAAESTADVAGDEQLSEDQRRYGPTLTIVSRQRIRSSGQVQAIRSEVRGFLLVRRYRVSSTRDSGAQNPPDH